MKKILILSVLCLLYCSIFAQFPGGQRNGQQRRQQINGRFYGKVVDPSNKGVEAASVTLVQTRTDSATKKLKEIIVGGMLTTKQGDFSIENVPVFGRYKLKITGIGYKTLEKDVRFDLPNRSALASGDQSAAIGALDKDLGNIKLEVAENMLNNVTVTANKPALQLGVDRKIFNVSSNLVSAGGTAVDVMKNVPSVNVDIDGNVTLRNNAPQIFVDGRPTNLTLDQIPADAIESIEIITNPSAKYDASGGMAGILNIIMKKNRRVGYSGNIRANVDSRGKAGFGGDINIRQNKINFFASAHLNQRKSISDGTTSRTTFANPRFGTPEVFSTQDDRNTHNVVFGFLRGGFDYFIDNRNTITVNGTFVRGQPRSTTLSDIDTFYNAALTKYDYRTANANMNFRNNGAQLSYKHNFPKSGHELTADVTYNSGGNDNTNVIHTYDYYMPSKDLNTLYNQQQNIHGSNQNLIAQTDYTNPINDHSKFEAGARVSVRKINSASIYDSISADGSLHPTSSTIYNSKDNVYAAYATYSNQIKKFCYQVGLRAESSNYDGVVPDKSQSFNIKFPVSLFPSVFLSEKISDNDQLQLNYSRRINRPNFWQLFPFIDSSDLFNITVGNPGLKPEFTNSFELSYSKTFKNKDNFLASLYYKHTTDLITRFQTIDSAISKTAIINTYINANSSYVTGLELIGRNRIAPWWDLITNLNLFTARINIPGQTNPDQFPSYFAKINNTFKLPKNFSVQLSADYTSKIVSGPGGSNSGGGGGHGGFGFGGSPTAAQGYIRANYGVDAAVRYDFLKNKAASISLSINDIFRTRKYDAHSESDYFVQDILRTRDPQIVRLNFNYRFGKFDASLFKRKNNKSENDNTGGDQMNF